MDITNCWKYSKKLPVLKSNSYIFINWQQIYYDNSVLKIKQAIENAQMESKCM